MMRLFVTAVGKAVGTRPNLDQWRAILAGPTDHLFIVAGPGSGKTTVLALRVLKLIVVDGFEPETIIATTFTRKAAKELRSRVLLWGNAIQQYLNASAYIPSGAAGRLLLIDFNASMIDTLDSLAEQLLTESRLPGQRPPNVIEDFVAKGLFLKNGLFASGRYNDPILRDYVERLNGGTWPPLNPAKLAENLLTLRDRLSHDVVDESSYRSSITACSICGRHPHPGVNIACDAINDYRVALLRANVVDYAGLEEQFWSALSSPTYSRPITNVLVDEYQDTNALQQSIYFRLAELAIANGGGLSVVGDDDQSLYRFRGATVELFTGFPAKAKAALGIPTSTVYLVKNYRSTKDIVNFCNDFAQLDTAFQPARVARKPALVPARKFGPNIPVLGMFRDDISQLAADLATFVHDVFYGHGYVIPGVGTLHADPAGTLADAALLTFSPREETSTRLRLPGLLRQKLMAKAPSIPLFNPRGQNLDAQPDVMVLCGLLLECIDPRANIETGIANLPTDVRRTFASWRTEAQNYARSIHELQKFVAGYEQYILHVSGTTVGVRENMAELTYKLVSWIPPLQDDIEGVVRLEVVLRAILESARLNGFDSEVLLGGPLRTASVRNAIWDIFVPLAGGALDVDEELLATLPDNRLSVLSIHQSKGLEFPLVIVDVGSDFSRDHPQQRRSRFPETPGFDHNCEDEVRPFSTLLGAPSRSALDRTFDDLVRRYFVAYSRAQDVLLIVGLNAGRNHRPPRNPIRNVATGWDRNEVWQWGNGLPVLLHI